MSKKYLNSSPALHPCGACSCRVPAPCRDGGGAAALPRGARGAHTARLGEPTSHGAPPAHHGTKGAAWPGEGLRPTPHTSQGLVRGGLSLPQAPRNGCRAVRAPCRAQHVVKVRGLRGPKAKHRPQGHAGRRAVTACSPMPCGRVLGAAAEPRCCGGFRGAQPPALPAATGRVPWVAAPPCHTANGRTVQAAPYLLSISSRDTAALFARTRLAFCWLLADQPTSLPGPSRVPVPAGAPWASWTAGGCWPRVAPTVSEKGPSPRKRGCGGAHGPHVRAAPRQQQAGRSTGGGGAPGWQQTRRCY